MTTGIWAAIAIIFIFVLALSWNRHKGLQNEVSPQTKVPRVPKVVLAVFLCIAIVIGLYSISSGRHLKASVSFRGYSFSIRNENYFDWTNCTLEVNGGLFKDGYILKVGQIAGTSPSKNTGPFFRLILTPYS